jgi:hypothetical protein
MPMDMRDMMAPPPGGDDSGDLDTQALLAALDQVKAQIDDIAAQLVTQKPKPDTESPAEEAAPDEEAD